MSNLTYKRWTQTDLDFILNNSTLLDKDLASRLTELNGRIVSESMVRRQRRKMGIVKKRGRPPKNTVSTSTL